MTRNLLNPLAATLVFVFVAVSIAGAQPPTTTTDWLSGTDTFSGEGCRGEIAEFTQEWTAVVHTTLFDDGRLHVAGTMDADISWTQSDGTYIGQYRSSFAQNSNNRVFNGIIMINGQANGSDGSKFFLRGVIHTTVNANEEVTVTFDRFFIECR